VATLFPQVFEWACSANPSQPLTIGLWSGHASEWSDSSKWSSVELTQIMSGRNGSKQTSLYFKSSNASSFARSTWHEQSEALSTRRSESSPNSKDYRFGYYECDGCSYSEDTAGLAGEGRSRNGLAATDPMQIPPPGGKSWAAMQEEVYHNE